MYGFIRDVIADKGGHVYTIPVGATVQDAVREMNLHGIGALLVLRLGHPAGIFSERDVLRRVVDAGMDPRNCRVEDVMTTDVISVTPETPVDHAMEMMTRMRCRHFPVFDGDDLRGLVSIGDLMRWVHLSQQAEIGHMTNYIRGGAPV